MLTKTFFVFVFFFVLPVVTFGATFSVETPESASLGEEFLVRVFVDTEGDVLNALSGSVPLEKKSFSIERIYDGESIVSVWVDRPLFDTNTSRIVFSGFTPGGFVGKHLVFSFVVKAKESDVFETRVGEAVALKNDGEGSSASTVSLRGRTFVSQDVSTSTVAFVDSVSPEVFEPVVSQSELMFEGRPFVSFATLDKGSGIDHYEYAYAFFMPRTSNWKEIESPFELEARGFSKRIFIKAIDRMGNERVVSVVGPTYYRTILLWVILSGIVLCVLFFTRRFFVSRS
ncbi:MAG TPA: hypothetical protein PLB51_03285 [Candidatus Paceibacterota bacterium]|jgi:hypothetical protein|nr:hypothetical protein [Candidatus Paceibacterota bacterium]